MINYIKSKLIANLPKNEIIKIRNLEINEYSKTISKTDLALIHHFLNFTPSTDNLFCSIRTWSDDVFVNISCKSTKQKWGFCTEKLMTVSEIVNDSNEEYMKDFLWLVVDEECYDKNHHYKEKEILDHVIDFINERKKEYQSICSKNSMIYFEQNCTINSYKIVWGQEDHMNYILYDIG